MKNVVLLTIDTLRRDVLGCYGNDEGLSPFIDGCARDGLLFTRNYTVAPYTQASFPGILTGSYYFDFPTEKNKLSPSRTLVSEPLKKGGIITAAFHSNPYLCGIFGWDRGWDRFYDSIDDEVSPMNPYIKGDVLNAKVDNWLANYSLMFGGKPFFLWVHYMDVHEPYIPKREHIDRVDGSIGLSDEEMFGLFKNVVLTRDASDAGTVDLLRKLYKAHVVEIDENTRALFDILKKHRVMDDSTVIITTDHGDEFGDHGSLSHDGKFFEELVHCPCIVTGAETGRCDTLVSGIDISPTVLSLFGLPPEDAFQGTSLLPTGEYAGKPCFGEAVGKLRHKILPTDRPAFYMRDGTLKISCRMENGAWELYDLESDPLEKNNIIESSPRAAALKEKLGSRIDRELQ